MIEPLRKRLPKRFSLNMSGGTMEIHAVCATTHELDAIVEALQIIRDTMPSTRPAVAADIGVEDRRVSFAQRMREFLG